MRKTGALLLLGLALVVSGSMTARTQLAPPRITHGIASGDVSSSTVVIWGRSDREAVMTVRYYPVLGAGQARETTAVNSAAFDFTTQVKLTGLQPGTTYRYEVSFLGDEGTSAVEAGRFRTAADSDVRAAVSFIWSGDLGGQRYCRQVGGGYSIFRPMTALRPDFFIANGDMIYADAVCPERGPGSEWVNIAGDFPGIGDPAVDWQDAAQVREVYRAHWRYNREDPAFQEFLRSTPMYVQWDDHEVINDFGARRLEYGPAPERPGYPNIVAAGRQSFFDYHPFDHHPDEPDRIYRSYRWGRDVELFILDARSYRSDNALGDSPGVSKTMLGAAQLDWLKASLTRSTATWKIVSSDVPLSIPTGSRADEFGRDAWANGGGGGFAASTGFESELLDLLQAVDRSDVRNVVFVTTDVHFAAQFRYELDLDGDGDLLLFHEFVSGPLSANRSPAPRALDPTLGPTVLYAEGDIFNFGTVRIGSGTPDSPRLWTDIRDETGRVRPGSELELAPQR